jgi:lysyl endopeptidase
MSLSFVHCIEECYGKPAMAAMLRPRGALLLFLLFALGTAAPFCAVLAPAPTGAPRAGGEAARSERACGSGLFTEILLPPLNAAETARLRELEITGPLRLGIGRDVPQGQAARATGRQAFSLRLRSAGAAAIRLALRVSQLPDAAILRLCGAKEQALTIRGARLNAAVRQGEDLYWLPLMVGEVLGLELALPGGAEPMEIALAKLSHFYRLPALHPDNPACPAGWEVPSAATALLVHTDPGGESGVCTGTLLADADRASAIPYLLSAHHCIPDQARASSLQTYWFPCGHDGTTRFGGADLLYASKSTDTSFLRLRRSPPAGAGFAAWSPTLPPPGEPVTGIHHPRAGPRQIVFGKLIGYIGCELIDYCAEQYEREQAHYLQVRWSSGTTAAGSSGSGLFLPTGQLVGTLSGGVENRDDYGRFDLPYREALHRWLGPAPAGSSLVPSAAAR